MSSVGGVIKPRGERGETIFQSSQDEQGCGSFFGVLLNPLIVGDLGRLEGFLCSKSFSDFSSPDLHSSLGRGT